MRLNFNIFLASRGKSGICYSEISGEKFDYKFSKIITVKLVKKR
jgi:hypothetical protein